MTSAKLPRAESLKSRKWLDEIFTKGKSDRVGSFILSHRLHTAADSPCVKVAFTVSKRRFKRASDRNRIKRLMREAYRLNKHVMHEKMTGTGLQCLAVWVYFGPSLPVYSETSDKISKLISRFKPMTTSRLPKP